MISPDFIEGLLARADIVDVVGRHVKLEKRGKDYFGLCPFHSEKSPSFTVSPAKQFFHCFGCGANGSAIGFLMQHRGTGFVETVRELAADLNLPLPDEHTEPGGARSTDRRQPQGARGAPTAKHARQPSGKPAAGKVLPPVVEQEIAALNRAVPGKVTDGVEGAAVDAVAAMVAEPDGWHDAGAWPPDGPPPPKAHSYRGRPQASWAYRDAAGGLLGYVHRFTTSSGGKEILPCVWSAHPVKGLQWRWRAFDAPRPLYALPEIARDATRPVLVVEGEKCVEAAQPLLPDWAVTTWPGGCKAVGKAHWELLAGRRVVLWPDCDAKLDKRTGELFPEHKQPGAAADERIAAVLAQLGCDVSIVCIPPPGDRADGWDVADLIDEAQAVGADPAGAVRQWLDPTRLRAPRPAGADSEKAADPRGAARAGGAGRPPPAPGGSGSGSGGAGRPPGPDDPGASDPESAPDSWRAQLSVERGGLAPTIHNVATILRHDSRWRGVLAFDSFNTRTIKRAPPPFAHGATVGEWDGIDDTRCAEWLQRHYGGRIGSLLVSEAVEMVSRERTVHPVVEWLRSLKWDGERRLERWLVDCAGAEDSDYTRAVSTFFLRGMVQRVLQPGCKFDFCLVLEGPQGIGKSSLARVLGGAWYSDTDLDLQHKDSMAALAGKWVHEFSELDSLARTEATRHKSFLSRQVDEFRPVYGRRVIKCPRQVVFVGTTNEEEYVRDTTGARRFWPVACGAIDVTKLAAMRDLLFAEAYADIAAGERCWPDADESRALFLPQQAQRVVQESLVDALHDWVWQPSPDQAAKWAVQGGMFSLAQAAIEGLRITAAQLTRDFATRVGRALHQLGCEKVEKRNGMTRYWYKPPKKRSTSERPVEPAQQPSADPPDPLPF